MKRFVCSRSVFISNYIMWARDDTPCATGAKSGIYDLFVEFFPLESPSWLFLICHRSGKTLFLSGFRRKHSLFDSMIACILRPWQESNLRTRLRKPMLYPLSYRGGVTTGRLRPLFTGHINQQHFLILFLKRVCKKDYFLEE